MPVIVSRRGCFLLLGWMLFQFTADADQIIYSDSLQNGWQDWSWAAVKTSNASPVHSGACSISVNCTNWSALYLGNAAMSVNGYTNLSFWINGGAKGGQTVQAQATLSSGPQAAIQIGPLPTNAWRQVNLSTDALGITGAADFTGFWIQCETSGSTPAFYVDDIVLQSGTVPQGTNAAVVVRVDALQHRHPISPLVYGVAFATNATLLADLNAPLHRSGGNGTTRYNWQTNASNHANDWYFESLPSDNRNPGGDGDDFIQQSKAGGAQPMLTIPMIGYVARLGPNSGRLASYSISKYGAQTGNDWQWFSDAGNGISSATSQPITNNNPLDANQLADTNFQAGWVKHLTNVWGNATNGGLRYYIMDNEWSLWHSTHRDVHPAGATMTEVFTDFCNYATMVKGIDPNALVAGPEEWSWPGYLYSGFDQQWSGANSDYDPAHFPDRTAHGGQDFSPWFLSQVQARSQVAGKRLLDVFTLHCYPQETSTSGNDVGSGAADAATALLRNRSTRQLWDTNYVDPSWIGSVIALIPRMKSWVAANYPGTQTGITEYDWGAGAFINGATAQADLLGIFGREGLDLATRWTCPGTNSPVYNAFKMYRNYDGRKSAFGDISVAAAVPNADNLAAFAAVRTSDRALTVMVINKALTGFTPLALAVTNFANSAAAQAWQLTAGNVIARLADIPYAGGVVSNLLPAQSITLLVLPAVNDLRLRVGSNAPARQLELWLDGQGGESYTLKSSTDLKSWAPVSTNTLATNSFRYVLGTTNGTRMFYRVVLNPP